VTDVRLLPQCALLLLPVGGSSLAGAATGIHKQAKDESTRVVAARPPVPLPPCSVPSCLLFVCSPGGVLLWPLLCAAAGLLLVDEREDPQATKHTEESKEQRQRSREEERERMESEGQPVRLPSGIARAHPSSFPLFGLPVAVLLRLQSCPVRREGGRGARARPNQRTSRACTRRM
jgi:hypothetical protein